MNCVNYLTMSHWKCKCFHNQDYRLLNVKLYFFKKRNKKLDIPGGIDVHAAHNDFKLSRYNFWKSKNRDLRKSKKTKPM